MEKKLAISELADRIRKEREENLSKEEITMRQEYIHAMIRLQNAFNEEFKTVVHLLLNAGIVYSVHRHHAHIPSFGAYVKFERVLTGKILKMDVLEVITENQTEIKTEIRWRYAYTPFGQFTPMNFTRDKLTDFIVWIDDNLIK